MCGQARRKRVVRSLGDTHATAYHVSMGAPLGSMRLWAHHWTPLAYGPIRCVYGHVTGLHVSMRRST